MKVELLQGDEGYRIFNQVSEAVYAGNRFYRATEASVEKMLLKKASAFSLHADVSMFLIRNGNDPVARFALIRDAYLTDYVQVSYFEALEGLGDVFSLIRNTAKTHFPDAKRIVVGLNGHLNYGAGILMNRFDEVPVFGLPYNPSYYAEYFSGLSCRNMLTFRFRFDVYTQWARAYDVDRQIDGLTVRFMDKKNIEAETKIYTDLNNQAFIHHPYWAKREIQEDVELFKPFRHLLDNENLVFAEVHGKPVGFFLWYPDFNQLVTSQRDLNALDVIKYRLGKKIDTFRFTEIGVIPEYQGSRVALALISKALPAVMKHGFSFCEGGFIFEENRASVAFVKGLLRRSFGSKPEEYRRYATFETAL